MTNVPPGCKHLWKKDFEELICYYCGMMLYRNRDTTGPCWLPPWPGDKAPYEQEGMPKLKGSPRKKH